MKTKSFVLALAILCSSAIFAQTEKGNLVVSGSTSLQIQNSSWSDDNGSTTTVQFNPSIGYFVANNLCVGVSLSVMSQDESSQFSILPSLGYYFPVQGSLKPYLQLGLGYGSLKSGSSSVGGLAVGAGGGVAYFLNENVSLDFGLQYLRNDYDGYILNNVGGLVGFSIFF
ncbi:putative OprF membrane domain protein [uncultured Paludibacter sp.]|nr:putative OprF membrane domain protein [uncultured Paludibacter sp.]